MTVLAAACALIDDLVDSGSFLRSQVSACDYGVLETAGGCAIVARPVGYGGEMIGFGNLTEDVWSVQMECLVLDTGDPQHDLEAVWHMFDAVKGSVNAGSTLNTATRQARVTSITHNPGVGAEFGGREYYPVFATVEVKEDP